ncbi:CLUMA_CG016680, isoform A [Clunio marinus]|uniref:CLUMA_CG016680, isoform A n=1 Tax=Clunio marinus TaxID=568069 RepID=A0A1J1ITP1_9DIPT|nr:CLUMA_CG016680, isoform A [Clunio marinus]
MKTDDFLLKDRIAERKNFPKSAISEKLHRYLKVARRVKNNDEKPEEKRKLHNAHEKKRFYFPSLLIIIKPTYKVLRTRFLHVLMLSQFFISIHGKTMKKQ